MAFKVDLPSLEAFAAVLESLSDDVAEAKAYLDKHLSYDYGDARMFFTIASSNNDTREAVSGSLDRLGDVVSRSAEELGKSVAMYRATDDREEQHLDSTYPSK